VYDLKQDVCTQHLEQNYLDYLIFQAIGTHNHHLVVVYLRVHGTWSFFKYKNQHHLHSYLCQYVQSHTLQAEDYKMYSCSSVISFLYFVSRRALPSCNMGLTFIFHKNSTNLQFFLYFNRGGLELCLGGISPPLLPRSDGTVSHSGFFSTQICFLAGLDA